MNIFFFLSLVAFLQFIMTFCIYEVRQSNSRNGSVKAKFADLCTSGFCRLRSTLLVKLCTSSNGGATAGNSLEIPFPEYFAVNLSRCVGCQECQQILVSSGSLFVKDFLDRNSQSLDGPVRPVFGSFLPNRLP
jgi:hypothetical protein